MTELPIEIPPQAPPSLKHRGDEDRRGAPSYEELRQKALAHIRTQAGHQWTDHNLHDPGITLMEAGLWAVADLLSRVDRTQSEAPVDLEKPALLPHSDITSPDKHHAVATTALDRQGELIGLIKSTSLAAQDSPTSERLTGPRPSAEREELDPFRYLRAAYPKELAAPPAGSTANALAETLLRKSRRRLLNNAWDLLQPALSSVLERSGGKATDEELSSCVSSITQLDPTGGELKTLLARLEFPLPPSKFEDASGSTTIWPPHPSQLKDCAPVTPDDLARSLHLHFLSSGPAKSRGYGSADSTLRIWAGSGAVEGLRWDGTSTNSDDPMRPGALSLLLEPQSNCDAQAELELLEHARRAFHDGCSRLSWSAVDLKEGRMARRPLGIELHFGYVRPVRLRMRATLRVRPGSPRAEVAKAANQTLREFYYAPDDQFERGYATGPAPGQAIDLDQATERLLAISGVETVDDMSVERVDGQGPAPQFELKAFEVPDVLSADLSELVVVEGAHLRG